MPSHRNSEDTLTDVTELLQQDDGRRYGLILWGSMSYVRPSATAAGYDDPA